MNVTTLEPPPVADDLAAFHNAQLATILAAPQGADRAAAAVTYAALLVEWADEAIAIRDSEVWRLKQAGWGPSQLARALGVSKSRGGQLLERAEIRHSIAQQVVARIRRRVGVRSGLRPVDDTP